MNLTMVLIASFAFSSSGAAQVWVPFANCGVGDQLRSYSYDRSSVVTEGASRTVTIKGDFSRVRGNQTAEGRILWTLDCANRMYVESARTEFRADGTVHTKYDMPTGRMGISVNSVADKLARVVCPTS